MDCRAIIEVRVEKNGRPYLLHLPVGAPFTECHEAAQELIEGINFLEQQAKDQAAAAAAQSAQAQPVEATPITPELTD